MTTPPRAAPVQRSSWARLLVHMLDIDMQRCPICGAWEPKTIASILEWPVIQKTLACLGLDPWPSPKSGAREAEQQFAA